MIYKKLAFERRLQTQNVVHMLENRESGYTRSKFSQSPPLSYERQFYKAINPCLTISILIPPVYLRKFSPDGSKLLAFSHDQRSCIVYAYKGIASAGQLLNEVAVDDAEVFGDTLDLHQVRSKIFQQLFETKYVLRLCQGDSARFYLHREFSIFLEDGRYVLLAGMCGLNGCNLPTSDYELYPDLFDKLDPFSYIFFVVDLQLGVVTDEVQLAQDAICLSHNHGVSVHGNTIAILSRLRQAIYIYELVNGHLVKQEHQIGPRPRNCAFGAVWRPTTMLDVNTLLPITHVKQRALSFLYRQIQPNSPQAGQQYQEFYKNFEFVENMIIEKMQLVDSDMILLRYEERPKDTDVTPTLTTGEPQAPRRLYVFYGITSEDVVGVYPDDSIELMQLVEKFYDKMCNVRSLHNGDTPSSPTHYFMQQNCVNPNKSSPFMRQVALRFNPSVPVSTQSFSTSPYLNFNIFFYDDRVVSPLERPKPCSSEPIIFRDRATNLVKFRLSTKARRPHIVLAPRELCAFIWHPFEPLVLSIQKCMHVYAYKLHIYNHRTVVHQ